MQTRKTGLTALAIVAMVMIAIPAVALTKDKPTDDGSVVVAIVNGDKILKEDVLGALKNLSVKPDDKEKAFPVVVDQMINEKLINTETSKSGIEKNPVFQQRLEMARFQLIKTMYLENYLKDKINDKTVKAEYEKFKKDGKGRMEVHARHILVETEAEARQVIKDLKAGSKFEDLAKERSSGPTAKSGGDIGFFAKGEIIPEFSNAAFSLKPGNYTKTPVKSQFGWHVIRVEAKRERAVPEMKEVEGMLRNEMGQKAVEKLVMDLRAKADIKRFDEKGKPVK
ncbi:MAG: peptidylprolyl isomerase [Alphaproteobacteria bacterium]|nr:peptidylprolyl isomerase [Alphaproteobacteria bacterium]MCK5556508.1 peptidylprolyl isomerase [Alphaproteobacteria bacterium]MCK5659373.1 peptidylprolyl isomerase [Alphaproteobacteria bacterium]